MSLPFMFGFQEKIHKQPLNVPYFALCLVETNLVLLEVLIFNTELFNSTEGSGRRGVNNSITLNVYALYFVF